MDPKIDQIQAVVAGLRQEGKAVTASSVASALGMSRSALYRAANGAEALQALLREGADADVSLEERVGRAVRRLLSSRSLVSIGVAEIAAEVGVTPVTLFRRFGNREGMLRQVLDHSDNRTQARVLDLVHTPDPEAALAGFCAISLRELCGVRGLIAGVAGGDEESRVALRSLQVPGVGTRASLTQAFAAAMAAGLWREDDPAPLAELLVRLLLGSAVILPELYPDYQERIPSEAKRIAALFCNAMVVHHLPHPNPQKEIP